MLITCVGCGAKIRIPDSAAGKRVKCPKCANVSTAAMPDAEDTQISEKPLPPPVPIDDEPLSDEAKTKVTASGARIRPQPASADDDEDDDEPQRKRRRLDEDEDDYLDVRSDRRSRANSMATTAMTLGIVSIVMTTVGYCCCSIFGPIIAIICGGLAVTFGLMGRGTGSDGAAMTGIICGGIGLALGLTLLVIVIFVIGLNVAGQGGMFNFPKG